MADFLVTGCGGPGARMNPDGTFEIEGEGVRSQPLPPAVYEWAGLINQAAAAHGVSAPFIAGIMAFESGGKAQVFSGQGAQGLMELLPSTARGLAGKNLSIDEIRDPATNIDLGTKYLAQLWNEYHGNPVRVAFAYNAGGARCGAGRSKVPDEAHAPCTPNRFGLVADCYSLSKGTIDYAGPVLHYANAALASGKFAAGLAGPPLSVASVVPSGAGPKIFAAAALSFLAVTLWKSRG